MIVKIWLANYALEAGSVPDRGFFHIMPTGEKVLNSDSGRGRIYDSIDKFPHPEEILKLCLDYVNQARQIDNKMPEMNPTHLLLLYYANSNGMYWHADNEKNDGDNNHPIVSISIGNTCSFGLKLFGRSESAVLLESGDILIWGGPNRMLFHCVYEVLMNTCPSYLPIQNVRLNFTYRDAPNIKGKEQDFKLHIDANYSKLLPLVTNPQEEMRPLSSKEYNSLLGLNM